MDFRSVAKFLGLMGTGLGVFMLAETAVGLAYGESVLPMVGFTLLFILANLALWWPLRSYPLRLGIRESILSVNLLWILLGAAGAVPLLLYTSISPASAFFEAISGFTTTGATIYTHIEDLPRMILFHRSLMHWLGGMGVIVLGVGLLSVINPSGSLSLFKAESTGIQVEKLTPRIKDTALSLWGVYLLLTVVDALLLKFFGMGWFDAVNHAFSTVSTGGFSTKDGSLGFYAANEGIIWVTTLFMMLSGVNFLAHLRLLYGGDPGGYESEEVKAYFAVFLLIGTALTLVHMDLAHDSFYHASMHAYFTIASVMTTTGFVTIDYGEWSHLAVALIFVAMFVGGNAGSTAGGVKVIRYLVIFKTLFAEFRKILHPNALINVYIDRKRVGARVLSSVFGFFILFTLTVVATSVYIYARGYDEMTSISGALALVGNIGPGFAHVGPAENFAQFDDIDKLLFSFVMIVGRLECFTVFVLFSRSFWRRF